MAADRDELYEALENLVTDVQELLDEFNNSNIGDEICTLIDKEALHNAIKLLKK